MKAAKRVLKEQNIISAATRVISRCGYHMARIDDIAKEAGITKMTLYSYFQSKENLYLAIIYNAFQALNESFYSSLNRHRSDNGLETTIAIFENFFSFCEHNLVYSEAILDYFAMIRSASIDFKSFEEFKDSIYYDKIQDIQRLPFRITVRAINKGRMDGTIKKSTDALLHTIQGWTMVVGYIRLLTASGKNDNPLLNVNPHSLKALNLRIARLALTN